MSEFETRLRRIRRKTEKGTKAVQIDTKYPIDYYRRMKLPIVEGPVSGEWHLLDNGQLRTLVDGCWIIRSKNDRYKPTGVGGPKYYFDVRNNDVFPIYWELV